MSADAAIADPLFRSPSFVKRIAYLANKAGRHSLSVLRFTLHEIRFTRNIFQGDSRQTVLNPTG